MIQLIQYNTCTIRVYVTTKPSTHNFCILSQSISLLTSPTIHTPSISFVGVPKIKVYHLHCDYPKTLVLVYVFLCTSWLLPRTTYTMVKVESQAYPPYQQGCTMPYRSVIGHLSKGWPHPSYSDFYILRYIRLFAWFLRIFFPWSSHLTLPIEIRSYCSIIWIMVT